MGDGSLSEGGEGQCLPDFFFSSFNQGDYFFFSNTSFSCTHFLFGSSCQNIIGLQRTAKVRAHIRAW